MQPAIRAASPASELDNLIHGVTLGEPRCIGEAWIVPVCARRTLPDALLLEEGIAAGVTSVEEVSDQGVVSRVRVRHRGDGPLLLVDGEQIVGAKQNRILNASFVIAPHADAEVPVSCVEQGRWRAVSQGFRAATTTVNREARSRKLRRVAKAVTGGRGYDADQSAVWSDVKDFLQTTGVHSGTMAFDDGYASQREATDRALSQLRPMTGQIGLALVRRDRLLQMDLFGSMALCARAFDKIARGILVESSTNPEAGAGDGRAAIAVVRHALEQLASATVSRHCSSGLGETLHREVGTLAFGAAVRDGELYHVVVTGA